MGIKKLIKVKKKNLIKNEEIIKTKFVAYSVFNFDFYYSSKSRKNVKAVL